MNTIPWGKDIRTSTSEKAASQTWGYWQNRINRASLVMLVEEKILDNATAKIIANAQLAAEKEQAAPGAAPITDIMPLEKMLISHCGQMATLIHTGRSRQDIFATLNQARLRQAVLDTAASLNAFRARLLSIAQAHTETWMPAYTNGVQAMPITLGFYLWAFLESFERDFDRIRESYTTRINRSALGSAVLANSAWPLSRTRLAELLGFDAPIINSLDSSQVSLFDIPLEAASIAANVAVRVTTLLADVAQQYSQTRPWLLLEQGSTYGSSAMPQKRNPGIINKCRAKAGDVIGAMQTSYLRAHNLPCGMYDNKESVSEDNTGVFVQAVHMLELAEHTFALLRVNKERALEELNDDWTCTMALAETLQMKYRVPFRVGHTFASDIVTKARAEQYLPKTFPFAAAVEIYKSVTERLTGQSETLPLSEAEFRESLTPEYVVRTRVGLGAPNPDSTTQGLKAIEARLKEDEAWVGEQNAKLDCAQTTLDRAFENLLEVD
ncbi:MAG TPA: argininosuccinate lyase [Sutterella sp.]|nr:argininosuccinate lyase [Sutterella sp.]